MKMAFQLNNSVQKGWVHSPTKKTMNGYVLMNKEEKFILFPSNKIKNHLELYIDADVRALGSTLEVMGT